MILRWIGTATAIAWLAFTLASAAQAAPDYNAMLRRFNEFYAAGKPEEAMAEALKFEKAIKPAFGASHTNYGIALNHLGMAHSLAAKYPEAESYYKRALALWQKAHGPNHANVGLVHNNMAGLYNLLRRNDEALEHAKRAHAIFEKNYGKNHVRTIVALHILGSIHVAAGQYDQAEPILKQVLAFQRNAKPQNLPSLSAAYENLANLYRQQGRYAEAEENFKQNIAVREKAFGKDHPYTAEAWHNLGLVYDAQGRYAEAEALYRQALGPLEKHKHASLGNTFVSIGRIQMAQGCYADADALYDKAETLIVAMFGAESSQLAALYLNRGNARFQQGRYSEAEANLRRSLLMTVPPAPVPMARSGVLGSRTVHEKLSGHMTQPLIQLDPGAAGEDALAVFLDFDGTLVDIAARPDRVRLTASAHDLVAALHGLLGGAVAIVSGRPVAEIDGFLGGLRLPVAGVHGLERRGADGGMRALPAGRGPIEAIASMLRGLRARHPGLLVEDKGAAVALHYRARPDLEEACRAAMDEAMSGHDGVTLIAGKMVLEAKLALADKAAAIAGFLAEPEFAGRRALFAGDDRTDEGGFGFVNGLEGITIKVGDGPTCARYRAGDRAELMGWLAALADGLRGP